MPDEPIVTQQDATQTQPDTQPSGPLSPYDIWDTSRPGAFKERWQEALPEEYDPYKPMLANYGSLPNVLKAWKSAVDKIQQKGGVKPLTAESTPEDIAAYRREMGIPEEPYAFDKPQELPPGVEWRDDRMKKYGEWAHKSHLTPAQAQEAMKLYMEFVSEDAKAGHEAMESQRRQFIEQEQQAIKEDWGGKLPTIVNLASRAALAVGVPPEYADPSSEKFQGRLALKLLTKIGELTGESKLPNDASVRNNSPLREYQSITQDKSNPKNQLWAKGDKETIAYTQSLLKRAKEMGEI